MPYCKKEEQQRFLASWFQEKKQEIYNRRQIRRSELKQWLFEIKQELGCAMCPESDAACLDFHHREPTDKDRGICEMANLVLKKERIMKEIEKCICLCSNCHRKLHFYGPAFLERNELYRQEE